MRALLLLPALVLSAADPAPAFRVVGKPIADMPAGHDATRPEGAYAALMRAFADGCPDLRPFFPTKLHAKLPKNGTNPRPEPLHGKILGGRIEAVLEVGEAAAVLGTTEPIAKDGVDVWYFEKEAGRWVALGNDSFPSLEKAQAAALEQLQNQAKVVKAAPAAIANRDAHLATFTKHLTQQGKEPKTFLLDALKAHPLVGFGEIHNRVTSWDLLIRLVQDPAFAETTGTIYMELPRHGQALMDRFLASEILDAEPVREVLRSMFESGWPCKDEVDFLAAVWAVNHKLEPAKRLRVVLVDQSWDWSEVKTKEDLKKLTVDRDSLMAEAILADMNARPDRRSALFQVGYLHLPTGLVRKSGAPLQNAGQRLRTALGDKLFTVVQHAPVMGNRGGQLDGRVRKGLFDEAFAKVGNRPTAFALKGSAFGKEAFEMSMDLRELGGTLGLAFDGYLFLGSLEQDVYSQVAPGFYTDAFALEVDRRCQIQYGASAKEVEDIPAITGAALEAGKARWMGKPAFWVDKLGSMDEWRK